MNLVKLGAAFSLGFLIQSSLLFSLPISTPELKEAESQVEGMRSEAALHLRTLDEVLSKAFRQGSLKGSTYAYYQACLEQVRRVLLAGHSLDEAYLPPKFDPSPEMEPINTAWEQIRTLVRNQGEALKAISSRINKALPAKFNEVFSQAEVPEDLGDLPELAAFYQRLRIALEPPGSADRYNRVLLPQEVVDLVRRGLEARTRGDFPALVDVVNLLNFRNQGQPLSTVHSVGIDGFRERLMAPYEATERQAAVTLEKAFIAQKPIAELEALLRAYQKTLDTLAKFDHSLVFAPRPHHQVRTSTHYIQALTIVGLMEEKLAPAEAMRLPVDFGEMTFTPDFRRFVTNLSHRVEAYNQDLRNSKPSPEHGQRALAERKAEEARQKAQAAIATVRATVKERLQAVSELVQLQAFVTELPAMLPERNPREEVTEWQRERQGISSLQEHLRSLATLWESENASALLSSGFNRYAGEGADYHEEITAIREKALRSLWAKQIPAPELLQSPLKELPPVKALDRLVDSAVKARNWKSALTLLELIPQRREMGGSQGSQQGAIKAYLVGLNLEQAEQFREAAMSYQSVLQQVRDDIPLKESAERLKALRAAHPESFR